MTAQQTQWNFTSLDWWTLEGRGQVAVVESPVDWDRDKPPFLGDVVIDGKPYVVIGVEAYAIPVIRKGTKIGLLVRP